MRTQTFAFRAALIALLLAALACNAVTNALGGGDSRVEDAQATADALSTEAAEQIDDLDDFTPPVDATPEAEEPVEEAPTDDTADEPETEEPEVEEPEDSGDIIPGDGPEDVPVMEGERQNFFASADVVTYLTPAPYADVVAFYKTEMENNGWTYDASLSTEFGEIAALTFNKDSRTATVSILTDITSGSTLVAVNIAGN